MKSEPAVCPEAGKTHHHAYFEHAPVGMFVCDKEGLILDANAKLCAMLGHEREALIGSSVSGFLREECQPFESREMAIERSDGARFCAEASIAAMPDGRFAGFLRDITAQKTRELEASRMTRLYAALSQVNQAIVWTTGRDELFLKICQVLIEHGGFIMAWIGWHDPETGRIMPVAVWGEGSGYIRGIEVYGDDRPEGRGPTGTAFRTGIPYISNDMVNDPATLPWRREIMKWGFRASAVFPISENSKVRGALTVYSDQPDFFQDREIELLKEAAGDISFALDNLYREEMRKKAEAEAVNERHFSDTMLESMPGILYFYDDQGRFLRWNRNFETVSGYSGDEISRMHPLDFFPENEKEPLKQRIAEVFEKGESFIEASFLAKNGIAKPYYFTGRRVVLDGKPCLVGMGIDISERLKAELEFRLMQGRLEAVVENLREGLVIADPDGDLLRWNPESLRILGFEDIDEGRRRQREFAEIFELHTLDGEMIPSENWPLARVRRGESLNDFQARVNRIGSDWEKIISYTGSRVSYAGGRKLVFLTLQDITDRKKAETALLDHRDELERQVAERTADLKAALLRAEAADRIKSAFLATMSHELRTPLNSIIGFTGILVKGMAGPLTPEQARQLAMVQGSARHLLELINDVLDISKIEAGQTRIHLEHFDLRLSIERVLSSVRPMAEKKGIALDASISPELVDMLSDKRRVEQILLNLLNNAIKFTDAGSITLAAQRVERSGPDALPFEAVEIRVSDTGIGIKQEDLDTLFQPFRQLDSGLTRQHEGTGLGLAICRRLSSLLGGEIRAASTWGKGSEFSVILPLRSEPMQ